VRVLLDTRTIAEVRKPRPDARVITALEMIPDEDLFLSVLSVGEVTKGVMLLEGGTRRDELSEWLVALHGRFADRILPLDLEIAKIWGELTARAQKQGITIPPIDGLLAAAVLRHGMHVMTRNSKHFEESGAQVINPWLGT
jgi:predicted nucleic acid-binding protein